MPVAQATPTSNPNRAVYLVQQSGGLAPRGKYHLARVRYGTALCRRGPSMSARWNVTADRDEFEAAGLEHRICKDCLNAEESSR